MGKSVLIINGPNLNMLGTRQPEVYGSDTLADIEAMCTAHAEGKSLNIDFRQTNDEGEMVNWIQDARTSFDAIVINAAAYTHTSIAVLDALLAVDLPIIEVHLSNIHQRDEFRQHSYVAKAATGMICGLGAQGYILALDALASRLES
jgi:3-dehydroquinate dehydratase II